MKNTDYKANDSALNKLINVLVKFVCKALVSLVMIFAAAATIPVMTLLCLYYKSGGIHINESGCSLDSYINLQRPNNVIINVKIPKNMYDLQKDTSKRYFVLYL